MTQDITDDINEIDEELLYIRSKLRLQGNVIRAICEELDMIMRILEAKHGQ